MEEDLRQSQSGGLSPAHGLSDGGSLGRWPCCDPATEIEGKLRRRQYDRVMFDVLSIFLGQQLQQQSPPRNH